ncbi:hypothetical protein AtubIFM55763_007454 [Aspergillus tubingensis]|nr:hypothetical protein AtubIFM54640_000039 [Aspergillus tubingensis]GLA75898.1 hypothetical protein AtubIFM55763_007454 [Aspergillus tubingensis]GLA93622.1 hypothetical protein AtubIFM57143_011222 [Aspergillus tubingensis]
MKHIGKTGRDNLGAAISMLALAVVSVALRLVVRIITRQWSPLSDGLLLLSLACMAVFAALLIQYIVAGPGPGTFDLNEFAADADIGGMVWAKSFLKTLYVADLFFMATISFVKLSVLAFLHGLFKISKIYRILNYVTAGLCVAWFLIVLFVNIFQCHPIHMLWDAMGAAEYCIASGRLWLGMELTNLFLDVMILFLPVYVVTRLQLSRTRKIQVTGIFLLGGLVCIASICKLSYLWIPATPQVVRAPETMVWSSVQLGVATLCACLPTYAPLFRVARGKMSTGKSPSPPYPYGSDNTPRNAPAGKSAPYRRVEDPLLSTQQTEITRGDGESYKMDQLGPCHIYVKQSVDVDVV